MHTIQTINWGELTPEKFLSEYWQKKPLLIKQALPSFQGTIDANELAGLAMEQEIESRIISQNSDQSWNVSHGPFEDFSQFGENNWTLLVQAVNNWSQDTDALINLFNFIPRWRIDDVMVSFSTPNGGVGPHLDQYDVFILQGEGKRRWQVGAPDASLVDLIPHPDLKQVSEFVPIIDEITEAGDLLYIPPNHPHNGVSIENSLNFSIGFQAPSKQDLWSGFADRLIDDNLGEERFGDSARQATLTPELLEANDINALKAFMSSQLENDQFFNQFIGKYLTQSHHTLELLIPMEPFTDEQVKAFTEDESIQFIPVSGIKSLIINEKEPFLFINGDLFQLSDKTLELAKILAGSNALTMEKAKSYMHCLKNNQLLTRVLNKGYWYVD
ncbi:cupin domain-containing protein [Thalassotalea profundi]|uniref:50S ribosomal protein L16 arginine hydroxylase n=1 Tax=Thalassotalea profundi TaxID=2036687 RepID=A0ABQ3IFT2_9GAMM|nr:cupin domain-containing protein [Thalassotalea profundi]GHE83049.1 50S ribosomal protein L16 arginine hydroxylase [Thalassotalea profundi]